MTQEKINTVAGAWPILVYLLFCWGVAPLAPPAECGKSWHMAIASSGEMLRGVSLSSSPPDKSYYHSCHFGRLLCQLHSGHNAVTRAVLHWLQRANIVKVRAVAPLAPADESCCRCLIMFVPAGDSPALLIVSDSDTWPLLTQAQNITIFLLFCLQYPQIRKSTRKKWNFRYA